MAELGPVVLNEHDLAAAVESVGKRMESYGLRVVVCDDGLPKPLHRDVLGLLFQSVRELLFNVVKHAGTDSATVSLKRVGGEVRVTVADSGGGFDASRQQAGPSPAGGFGLLSIRERLDLLGGRVEMDSSPGQGTRIELAAPLDENAGAAPEPAPEPPLKRRRASVLPKRATRKAR